MWKNTSPQILKNKNKIKNDWFENEKKGSSKRTVRKTGYEEINVIVYEWFLDARARNIPISGFILKRQALEKG